MDEANQHEEEHQKKHCFYTYHRPIKYHVGFLNIQIANQNGNSYDK